MKNKTTLVTFLPGIIMFIMALVAYKSGSKDLIVITPIFINSIIFLFQGIGTGVIKLNIFLSLLASSLVVLLNIYIFMNESALVFLIM